MTDFNDIRRQFSEYYRLDVTYSVVFYRPNGKLYRRNTRSITRALAMYTEFAVVETTIRNSAGAVIGGIPGNRNSID